MSIERVYSCNLCSVQLSPENLIGLYWVSGRAIEERPALQVEHHICTYCLDYITRIAANKGWQAHKDQIDKAGES